MSSRNWPGACKAVASLALALTLPLAPARALAESPRVVTLAPHITELIYAAGAGRQIVATVSSSDYPRQARDIPRIGDGVHLNAEVLVAMKPDMVLAWQPTNAVQALQPTLSLAGITIQYSQPRTLDDIPQEVLRFGHLFQSAKATKAAAAMQQRISALRERYSHRSLVSVFIDLGAEPLYTLGNDSLLNSVLQLCRGVNIYADAGVPAPLVTQESVLSRRPDVVLMALSQDKRVQQREAHWRQLQLKAAVDGHSYAINPDHLFRPGPRLIDAAESLCRDLDKTRRAIHG